ncbi:MAG: DUF2809 domain-containing protein, partial [Micrococcaceae bacterium]|nr:DUF2809 domain-containing protein [Micrococcaceae bacterium]
MPPVIALGLASRFLGTGPMADAAGGVLYAVLLYVLLIVLRPRAARLSNALAALGLCVALELFQLSGIPADLARSFPPIRLVLGTTFVPLDLIAYLIGAAGALGVDWRLGRAHLAVPGSAP